MAEQNKGFAGLLGNVFGTAPPAYMEGLLGQQATEDLRKRSIGTGIANALIGYAGMPKNQNLGLGRILAGAAQAGIGGARGVYQNATQDYVQGQAIEQAKQKQEQMTAQRAAMEQAIAQYPEYADAIRANPALLAKIVEQQITPRDRKTATVGNQVIDLNTQEVIFTGEKDPKALPTYNVQQGRTKITYQVQPDGTAKEIGRGSMDAPKAAAVTALYSNTPTETSGGYVYMPTAEGMAKGMPPIDINTGKPASNLMTKSQAEEIKNKNAPIERNESQSKSYGFFQRMQNSTSVFSQPVVIDGKQVLDAAGNVITLEQYAGKPEIIASALKALPFGIGNAAGNTVESSLRQQYSQAQMDWVRAKLRKESGAVIGADEMADEITTYFPQLGDGDAVIAQKAQARRVSEKAMGEASKLPNIGASGGWSIKKKGD